MTGTLADYLVPTATDFPVVRGESYGDRPASTNPLGIKGAGEGGIVGVAGAVANAVAAALRPLNAMITALPLSPPRVWQAIASAAVRPARADRPPARFPACGERTSGDQARQALRVRRR